MGSGTWERLDKIEESMATKDALASVKENTERIQSAMEEDDVDMAKIKKRLDELEKAR